MTDRQSSIKEKTYRIRAAADFHSHLRDGQMMKLVSPTIRQGGCNVALVMPNLQPPLTSVSAALEYRSRLQAVEPNVHYVMTLYLHPDITPAVIHEAAKAGITGVKVYPHGVTTNSESGVVGLSQFYPVFEAMQEVDMVLNLHGEVPSSKPHTFSCCGEEGPVTILNAEARFMPTLRELHSRFPRLRIVLEHCTTEDALNAVKECGDNVVATITAHHLFMTVDSWAGDSFNFCKPVAKMPRDRMALVKAVVDPTSKVFFGSDSAPHPVSAKTSTASPSAGCFTQPHTVQLVVEALEQAYAFGWIDKEPTEQMLEEFLRNRGRKFYKIRDDQTADESIEIISTQTTIQAKYEGHDTTVVPFMKGEMLKSLRWVQ